MESFSDRLIHLQQNLTSYLGRDDYPRLLLQEIAELMEAENVFLFRVEGNEVGPWAERNQDCEIKSYSLEVVRRAMQNSSGFDRGGLRESNPTKSQMAGNIISCIAARIEAGKKPIAVLYCDVRSGNRHFSEVDGSKLRQIGDCFASTVLYLDLCRSQIIKEKTRHQPKWELESFVIGQTPIMRKLKEEIRSIARTNAPVLLLGETGTGKEIVAEAIHLLSSRSSKEFVALNCAAINAGLFESELFGHERGAFSGALKKREGKVLRAVGGTLFLDEIGDIPPEFQIKLLRVLETKKVNPVGSDYELSVDFRLLSATNKNLRRVMADKLFREDFFYRISDVQLTIPSLRSRLEDIPILAHHFAGEKQITEDAIQMLMSVQDWPGNVRQLRRVVENACQMAEGYIISSREIARQLEYQKVQPLESVVGSVQKDPEPPTDKERKWTFVQMKKDWQEGTLEAGELENILNSFYKSFRNNWRRVANQLGVSTEEEIKAFRSWVYYLQKTKTINPPEKEK